ncbi:hypothetical protein NM688_g5099 [Phlebia brevispora]|uniref:Uncharacterized protein n=1 Tax=Phlebia brevispora TaxID=194682 RepID=A0ACC1T0Z5_9APHY|nr:hypothetical protein NM688_g5099 [Phlebia brevispora]
MKQLTRVFLSAGFAADPDNGGIQFLYTDDGNLIRKRLVDETWADEETIADDVRKGSPAPYLRGETVNLIFYITSSSELYTLQFDPDEEVWVDHEDAPSEEVHSEGNVTACLHAEGDKEVFYIFFQDPSQNIVCLDNTWTRSVLPAKALAGTALSATVMEDVVHVFYVSESDRSLHYIRKTDDGWVDDVAAKRVPDEPLRCFTVGQNEEKAFEIYAMTTQKAIVRITGGGEGDVQKLGKVDEEGKYVASTDAEFFHFIFLPLFKLFSFKYSRSTSRRYNITYG